MARIALAVWCFGMALFAESTARSQGVQISTLGGRAALHGYADGFGPAALFNNPEGLAVDSNGVVYVADASNNAIRKVAPNGATTTLAGGQQGSTNGVGTNASFNSPAAVAVDAAGNVYVADEFNNLIRKITPFGAVTTLAGGGGRGRLGNGTGTNAFFNHPSGLAVDGAGNVYVADTWNCAIRKVTTNGVVTTLAGSANNSGGIIGSTDGPGPSALFNYPVGLAVDSSTNLYVADTGNSTVRMITPNAMVTTLAGTVGALGSNDGQGTNGRFALPNGIAVAGSGVLYVADSGNNTIRIIASGGAVTTLAGHAGRAGGTDAVGTNALFHLPLGLALDSTGNIYVADTLNNSIRVIATNAVASVLAGPGGSAGADAGTGALARFYYPNALTVDASGNIYVADLLNFVVRKITMNGAVSVFAGQAGQAGDADGAGTNALFAGPSGVAVDSAGNVYVADADNDSIRVITPGGGVSTLAGQNGIAGSSDGMGTNATFSAPSGLAIDSTGNIYVADSGNNLIRQISPSGSNWVVTTLAGQVRLGPSFGTPVGGSADGTGTNATFNFPSALAIDSAGNIHVADAGNEIIRKITTNGMVTTFAGVAGQGGSLDGTGTNASFSWMSGLAVDGAGNVYVADTGNETIRMITSSGVVTTIGGVPDTTGSVDGRGAAALFSLPSGIAVAASGKIYVTDALNNTIRVGIIAPELQITGGAGTAIISWSVAPSGFVLETIPALASGIAWTTLTNGASVEGGRYFLTNPAGDPARFYRLRSP